MAAPSFGGIELTEEASCMFLARNQRIETAGTVEIPADVADLRGVSIYKGDVSPEDVERHRLADVYPLPPTAVREHYHGDRHYDYWLSGIRDYNRVMAYWTKLSGGARFGSYFDMGGSSGRVARHFAAMHPEATVYLSDLGISQIEWALTHLPRNIRAFQSTVLPQLPIRDGSVDIISAFSVFTHIDHHEYGWLAELARIAAPKGMLYITAMTEECWDASMALDWRYKGLVGSVQGFDAFPSGAPMPEVSRIPLTSKSGYGTTFHRKSHIQDVWARYFDICDIVVHPDVLRNGEQTLVIMRAKDRT
jgi:SAM-dependent methyltransferase